MKNKKTIAAIISAAMLVSLSGCGETAAPESDTAVYPDAEYISLSGNSAEFNGVAVEEFDYTWHCDPGEIHNENEDAPAEYHTGTEPNTDAAVYIDSDLEYYPELPETGFELVNYDGENEWAYRYTDGEHGDYIFATLPVLGGSLPTEMMHSEAEAAENRVLHITKAGTYVLEGKWQGQIRIDLGDKDDTFTDETAKVNIILNGAEINCSVAPGIVFYSAYECDNTWEERESFSEDVDTDDAGVTLTVADGTENSVTGTNVFRMLKTKFKDDSVSDEVRVQKKLRKTDGALYSYVTMNIVGEDENTGKLTVNSGFEGIDSELHMSLRGGNIIINAQDDGMNVNEDDVSVLVFAGSDVTINAGLGAEGDGVDSNGYVVIDGGEISINGIIPPDNAIDSEDGIYYRSGNVSVDGKKQELTPGSVVREIGNAGMMQNSGGPGDMPQVQGRAPNTDFDINEFRQQVAELGDDATLDDVLRLLGMGEEAFRGAQDTERIQDRGVPDGDPPQGEPPEKR